MDIRPYYVPQDGEPRVSCPAYVQVRTGTKVSAAIHPNSVLVRKS